MTYSTIEKVTNPADPIFVCDKCSAVVADKDVHDEAHQELSDAIYRLTYGYGPEE